jgi:hypothetical protein
MDAPRPPAQLQPPPAATDAAEERSRRRVWLARGLAAAADALQLFLFPLFGEGFASPAEVALDAAMALTLTKLVGFHWSYLPSAALELVPGADLAPTWTAAAWVATGSKLRWRWVAAGVIALLLCAAALAVWLVLRRR